MGTYVAPTPAIRTSRILIGVVVVALVGVLVVGVALATQSISFGSLANMSSQKDSAGVQAGLGPDYPAHYGLAGPSQIRPDAGSWNGYPPHFGLAGPSRIESPVSAPVGTGAGYPPHYGLSGPSQLDQGR